MSIYYNHNRFSHLETDEGPLEGAIRRKAAQDAAPSFDEKPEMLWAAADGTPDISWTAQRALDIIERSERDTWNSPHELDAIATNTAERTPTSTLSAIEKFFPDLRKQFENLDENQRTQGGITRTWEEVAAAIPDAADFLAGVSRLHSPQIRFINTNGQLVITDGGLNPSRNPLPYEISRAMATQVSCKGPNGETDMRCGGNIDEKSGDWKYISEMGLITAEELESMGLLDAPICETKNPCGRNTIWERPCKFSQHYSWVENGDVQVLAGVRFALGASRQYGDSFFPGFQSQEQFKEWLGREGEIETDLRWAQAHLPAFWAFRVNLDFKENNMLSRGDDAPTDIDVSHPGPVEVQKPSGSVDYDGDTSVA